MEISNTLWRRHQLLCECAFTCGVWLHLHVIGWRRWGTFKRMNADFFLNTRSTNPSQRPSRCTLMASHGDMKLLILVLLVSMDSQNQHWALLSVFYCLQPDDISLKPLIKHFYLILSTLETGSMFWFVWFCISSLLLQRRQQRHPVLFWNWKETFVRVLKALLQWLTPGRRCTSSCIRPNLKASLLL